jgi:hypothetical protein
VDERQGAQWDAALSKGGQTAEWSPIVGYQIMRFGSPENRQPGPSQLRDAPKPKAF